MKKLLLFVTLIAAFIVVGCGGSSDDPTTTTVDYEAQCETSLDEFLTSLETLDSKLDIGLSFNQYNNEVGKIKVVYDQIDIDAIDDTCLSEVGYYAEKAFRLYYKAGLAWEALAPESITSALWTDAHRLIETANSNLETLNESGTDTTSTSADI